MTNEEMLVKRARSGDEQAFTEIVRAYEKAVYNSALYFAGNEEDALDISQEVFLKLWRTLSSFRGDASLKTWIAKMTRSGAIDYIRGRMQKKTVSLTYEDDEEKEIDVADDDISSDPEASYERKEKILTVRKAVASLDDTARRAVTLREFHGLSYAEIAEVMKIPEGTVKSTISRGREKIKDFLKKGNYF